MLDIGKDGIKKNFDLINETIDDINLYLESIMISCKGLLTVTKEIEKYVNDINEDPNTDDAEALLKVRMQYLFKGISDMNDRHSIFTKSVKLSKYLSADKGKGEY